MKQVASESVAAYRLLCRKLARKYNGVATAEYDDLEQEALIAVWLALAHGYKPTTKFIERRMRNWIEVCRRKGFTGD